jgi:hypothetical protein
MNINIIQALDGVARAAAAVKDTNTVSLLQQAACMISKIGTAYDAAAISANPFLNPNITPYNGQIFDANAKVAALLSVPGQQLGA